MVRGGKPLKGTIATSSGKNAPLAVLAGTLLVRGESILHNMSQVEEVQRLLEIMASIGVAYEWIGERTLKVDSSGPLNMDSIDKKASRATRIVLLLMGALAAHEKQFKLYKSGGCKLGERTVRPHLMALEKFGVRIINTSGYYEVTTKKLKAADVVMFESGDTATENAVMAAVLAPGNTVIKYASANYMVQDLCHFLNAAGAQIDGIGTSTLHIKGVKSLHNVNGFHIIPDPVDAMAWISLAITTRSPLTVKNCVLDFLDLELEHLRVMGQQFTLKNERMSDSGHYRLADITLKPSLLTALPTKLHGKPYPGLNIDNVPLFIPILTQAKGQTLVHDWVYENRAVYYLELQKLGGQVLLLDPHRALVTGPSKLQAGEVICPQALRPGMAILIAMIAAKGTSRLRQPYMIERGYEQLIERLQGVGVDITRE